MNLVKIQDIRLEKFKIKNSENIGDKKTIRQVKYNSKRFIIQTPKTRVISFPTTISSNNIIYFKIISELYDYNSNDNTKMFVDAIQRVEKHIKQIIGFRGNIVSSVTFNNSKKKAYMTLNIQNGNGNPTATIFDENKKKRDFSYFKIGSKSANLITLESIINNGNQLRFNWILLQSKVYPLIIEIDEYLIESEDSSDSEALYLPRSRVKTHTSSNIINSPPKKPEPVVLQSELPKTRNIPPPPPQIKPNIVVTSNLKNEPNINIPSVISFAPPSASELQEQIKRLKKREKI